MSTEGNDLTVIRIWGDVAQRGCKEIEVMTLSGDQLYRFYRFHESWPEGGGVYIRNKRNSRTCETKPTSWYGKLRVWSSCEVSLNVYNRIFYCW